MYLHTKKHDTHMIYNYAKANHPITINMNIKMTNENWKENKWKQMKNTKKPLKLKLLIG